MKIPGKLTDLPTSQEQISLERTNRGRSALVSRLKESLTQQGPQNDEVKVSNLGQLLKEELNPAKMEEDRRKRIDELKIAIKEGRYNPPAERVAAAIANEISLEILTRGGYTDEGEEV